MGPLAKLTSVLVLLFAATSAQAQIYEGYSDGYGPWTNYAPTSGHFMTAYDEAYDNYESMKAWWEWNGFVVEYWGNDAWTDNTGPYRAKVRIYWIYY